MIKVLSILIPLVIVGVIAFIGWYFYMKLRFKTVSSNEALIITGTNLGDPEKESNVIKDKSGRYMKIIRGGGHRLKMFQTSNKISLKSFQLKLGTPKVYTSEGVGIYGEAVATIKVSGSDGIVQYAEQFLGKKQSEVETEIEQVLGSNLRAILSKMTIEEINGDREKFNEEVRKIAQEQLDRMGFEITSFGLTDLRDDDSYLENLGKPQVAKVQKEADIAEAENHRETEMKKAEVNEHVSKEKYQREMSIAETRKEKDLNDSRILAETNKESAAAESAYDLEHEERNIEIEEKKLNIRKQDKQNELELKRMERENEVELEQQQVEVERRQVEVRKEKSDADYYAKTREAQANAEARCLASEAEAESIKNVEQANIEALEKRAKAMNEHKEVLITEKLIEILPEYANAISSSLSNVESIRILDGGNGDQIKSLPQTVTNMMANTNEGLGQMTGIDLDEIINNLSKPSQHTNETNYHEVKDKDNNVESIETEDLNESVEPDNKE